MIGSLMRKIFGSANDRYVKSLQKQLQKSMLWNRKFPLCPMKN